MKLFLGAMAAAMLFGAGCAHNREASAQAKQGPVARAQAAPALDCEVVSPSASVGARSDVNRNVPNPGVVVSPSAEVDNPDSIVVLPGAAPAAPEAVGTAEAPPQPTDTNAGALSSGAAPNEDQAIGGAANEDQAIGGAANEEQALGGAAPNEDQEALGGAAPNEDQEAIGGAASEGQAVGGLPDVVIEEPEAIGGAASEGQAAGSPSGADTSGTQAAPINEAPQDEAIGGAANQGETFEDTGAGSGGGGGG